MSFYKCIQRGLLFSVCLTAPFHSWGQDRPLQMELDAQRKGRIFVDKDTLQVGYERSLAGLTVLTSKGYDASVAEDGFFHLEKQAPDHLLLAVDYNRSMDSRDGTFTLVAPDGAARTVCVRQAGNSAADEIGGDRKIRIVSGQANQAQPGEGIEKTFDSDYGTIYHSPWSNTQFPVTLTYQLEEPTHVDYLIYTPRNNGGSNGNFGKIEVAYATSENPENFITFCNTDLGESGVASQIELGEDGVDQVQQIRFTVNSGYGGFASCAEIELYEEDHSLDNLFAQYFEDGLCTRLKPEVTEEKAMQIQHPYVKQLVLNLLQNPDYANSRYRIAEYEAYEPVSSLAQRLKTSSYNAYENPTGIYFEEGKTLVAFVEGIGDDRVSLIIKNFGQAYEGEPQSESAYVLKNGVNVIKPKNRGNGYVSYYTPDYATAPKVKIHFAMATENGYFDLERGDTNEDWKALLANAKSDIMDIRTKRIQMAYPVARCRQYCPDNGRELALVSDSTIYYERDIMGLIYYDKEPKNRQFARVVWGGFMFADGIGAAAHNNSLQGWMTPQRSGNSHFEPWGFGHELGHVNQVRPGLKWVGCGETTNNIYAVWVEHKLGYGYHRLESEHSGVNDCSGLRGGRFNAYLEENVRKGVSWQLADGPDYYGTKPEQKTVKNQDYAGNVGGDTLVYSRNYDHFVKLVPFWQLQLYCHEAGVSPNVFGKVIEALRKDSDEGMSNGMHQMRFMRLVCDSTGLNFLPFFEKAGMLRPINSFIEDYGADWLKINQQMIDELKKHVADAGYPVPEGEINYISGKNWQIYRDHLSLVSGNVNEGCEMVSGGNGKRIKVQHQVWQNAVAFETYDANGNLLRISMGGLGEDSETEYNFTQVLWPETATEQAAYIMAVGWDGTRVKCYEKQ